MVFYFLGSLIEFVFGKRSNKRKRVIFCLIRNVGNMFLEMSICFNFFIGGVGLFFS